MKRILFIPLIISLFFYCEQNPVSNQDVDNSQGSVTFTLDMTSAPSEVTAIKGELSRRDFDTITFDFEIVNDEAVAMIKDLISGNWKLSVSAMNDSGIVLYFGETTVNVVPGVETPVYLNLDPTTGSLKIIVTWGDRHVPFAPVAFYPFAGSPRDLSPYGNHGTVFGAELTYDRFGNPNNAYKFDGVDDYIDIGNNRILKPQFPLTISAWINVASFTHHNHIFTNNFDDGEYFGVWMAASSYRTITLVFGDGGTVSSAHRRGIQTIDEIEANTWYHVVGIMYSYDEMDIYINGQRAKIDYNNGWSDSTQIAYNSNSGSIGKKDASTSVGNSYHFHGKIDDVMFFNRALSENEVKRLFNFQY